MLNELWENLSVDFCGFLLFGDYLFVIIDEFFRYLVVEVIGLILVNVIIFVFDKVIFVFGIFKVIKLDNGSLFNFVVFEEFVKNIGFYYC